MIIEIIIKGEVKNDKLKEIEKSIEIIKNNLTWSKINRNVEEFHGKEGK